MQEVERKLPASYQTNIDVRSIRTEREAAAYLGRMTALLHREGKQVGLVRRQAPSRPSSKSAEQFVAAYPPSLRMLADTALYDDVADQLGFGPFADALAGVIDSPSTSTPLVISLHAEWGAGKTSLARLVKRRLESKPAAESYHPHVTCWFNAWMHDDAPILATSLAAEIAGTADRFRPLWRRVLNPIPAILMAARPRRVWKTVFYLGIIALAVLATSFAALRLGYDLAAIVKLDPAVVGGIASLKGGAYTVALFVAVAGFVKVMSTVLPVAKSVADFVQDPKAAAKSAEMKDVKRELCRLISHATPKGSKFVVFIDDVDRCRPPRSVDVLEAVNQLLDHEGVVVVVMADMRTVSRCVEVKYKELGAVKQVRGGRAVEIYSGFGWHYLQKIVQLQVNLPIYCKDDIRRMLGGLLQRRAVDRPAQSLPLRILNALRARFQDLVGGKRRIRHRRAEIDAQIRSIASSANNDLNQVESNLRNSNPELVKDHAGEALVRERLLQYLERESEIQREAEDEVLRHLEPLPRHAKPILNRLRLLLFIAYARKMFGGSPMLTPRHLGKWVVLCERWPELEQSLTRNPNAIAAIEKKTDGSKYSKIIAELAPSYSEDSDLKLFLSSEPSLAFVLERIVQFGAADSRVGTVHRTKGDPGETPENSLAL
jgi:hypothetical protein